MKFRVLLDLEMWATANSKVDNNSYGLSNIDKIRGVEIEMSRIVIEWDSINSYYVFTVYFKNELVGAYHGQNLINNLGTELLIDCDPSYSFIEDILLLESSNFVDISGEEWAGVTNIITYTLDDEVDAINKSITAFSYLTGTFKSPFGVKQIELEVTGVDPTYSFNYVYIPKLKRFYYVTNIILVNKDLTRIILKEDVLMSWKTLIYQQTAFITRYEGATGRNLVDDRYPVVDIPAITYFAPINKTGSNCISFKAKMGTITGTTERAPNVLVKTVADVMTLAEDSQSVDKPTGTNLPDIQSRRSPWDHHYLLNLNEYGHLMHAGIDNDAPSSFIRSILLLPFDLRDIFADATGSYLYSGKKQLLYGNVWGDPTTNAPTYFETTKGGSPYIKVADFDFNNSGGITISLNYLDLSSNTLWEIYLPFVGWVQIDANVFYGKRIQVYYTFDLDTGMSTAFIYDFTNQKVLWAGSCQIGMKLPLAVSNREELSRQKQATTLNLLMGMLSSALSIGVGAYSGNAVAVAGGVMGAGKTIASAVNSYNSMFEKAQISYGSSDNALYNPLTVTVRKTTHLPVIGSSDEESKYAHINGYPYKQYLALSSLTTGYYIEVGEIHFDPQDYPIYQDEISEIVQLLKSGVIL